MKLFTYEHTQSDKVNLNYVLPLSQKQRQRGEIHIMEQAQNTSITTFQQAT